MRLTPNNLTGNNLTPQIKVRQMLCMAHLFSSPSLYITPLRLSQILTSSQRTPPCPLIKAICISLKNVLSLHSRKGGITVRGNASFVST